VLLRSVKLLSLLPLVTACADPTGHEMRDLADIDSLSAVVMADVGTPSDPIGFPIEQPALSAFIDYPGDDCYALRAIATVDDREPDEFVAGGFDGACTKPSLYVDALPEPRDISTIALSDASGTMTIEVARLFANPQLSVATTLSPGPQVILVDDPRAIDSATVWFRSDNDKDSWMIAADPSIQGQLRFTIPPRASGSGTLGVVVKIRDNAVTCVGWASCKAIVNGGASFAVTIIP
jgi:hypothetical protein